MAFQSEQAAPGSMQRSSLFVPGNRPDRFLKAVHSGAGIVIVDLEDAVAMADKARARTALAESAAAVADACRQAGSAFFVRVNAVDSAWHADDVRAVAALPVDGILLPKPASGDAVAQVWRAVGGKPLHLLMETAHAFARIAELAGAPGVTRLMLGCADLMSELDLEDDGEPLHYFRTQLLLHSTLAGLPPPVDGVCLALYDQVQMRREIARARQFGFTAKACIHPAQVALAQEGFLPSAQKLDWARRVLEGSADGRAASLDGRLIDGPIVTQARRLLARADA